MVTEIELKYSILESIDLASTEQVKFKICQLLSEHNLSFVHQKKQLSNHYFDTANLLLRHKKIALRTRGTASHGECERFEQTIKTSGTVIAGLHQRPEYNVDINDAKPILSLFPESLWQSGTDVNQLQQQIIELFSTNFTRHTWLITFDDAQVELAFDYGEIACHSYEHKPIINEVELELIYGDKKALFLLSKLLFSQLPLRPGQLTKAARGYALFKDSVIQEQLVADNSPNNEDSVKGRVINKKELIKQKSLLMITLSKDNNLTEAFAEGISYFLTKLQLTIDDYVESPSLNKLREISELLALLRQGFWLFDRILTENELKIRSEISYFIRTIHWVDNARYIDDLNNKQSSYQKEVLVNQALINKLQLAQPRYPNESQVLELLHSERFNNLQLSLLSMLLNKHSTSGLEKDKSSLLNFFSAEHLTNSSKALNNELAKLPMPGELSSTEIYLTAHSLLIRAILTTSWFSLLFVEPGDSVAKKFNMPWLDIKRGISELQSLDLLQQQLEHLPNSEAKLACWLTDKSENLIMALDQSRAKALSMKPYWP